MSLDTVVLRDEFNDTVAAGSVNGTLATDGVNTRTVVGASSAVDVSIVSGSLRFSAPAGTYSSVCYLAKARQAGLVLVAHLLDMQYYRISLNWYPSASGNPWGVDRSLTVDNGIIYTFDGSSGINFGTFTTLQPLTVAKILRASAGAFYMYKPGSNWLLGYITPSSLDTVLNPIPVISGYATVANRNIDYVRAAGYWLPSPLVSHGFDSIVSPSDGNGHTETSGLGSGGSSIVMSGTTWSVSAGKGINTPATGSEILQNAGFEGTYTGGIAPNWSAYQTPTTTTQETSTIHSGSSAQRFTGNSVEDGITQSVSLTTAGNWYTTSIWFYGITGTFGFEVFETSSLAVFASTVSATKNAWTKLTLTFRRANTGGNTHRFVGYNAAGESIIDDASIKQLTFSSLLSLHTSSTADVFSGIDITVVSGTQVGLALNWDSSSNPQNGVLVYFDGTNCKIDKCVAGMWTNVLSSAATVSRLIVGKIASSYRVYTPTALIGSVTIADAGIINNTLHGTFNTYEGNTVDNYTCYASGTSGEYNSALQIVLSNDRSSSMAMVDALAKLPVKILSDILSLSDSFLRTVVKSEVVQVALSSAVVRVVIKAAADILSLSDGILRTVIKSEVVQMALDSAAAKVAVKAFSDGIGLVWVQAINYGKRIVRIIRLLGSTGAN